MSRTNRGGGGHDGKGPGTNAPAGGARGSSRCVRAAWALGLSAAVVTLAGALGCSAEVPAGRLREVRSLADAGVVVAVNRAPAASWLGRVDESGEMVWSYDLPVAPAYLDGGAEIVVGEIGPRGVELVYRDLERGGVAARVALPAGISPLGSAIAGEDRDGFRSDVVTPECLVAYERDKREARVVAVPGRFAAVTASGMLFVETPTAGETVARDASGGVAAAVKWWAVARGAAEAVPAEVGRGDDLGSAPEGLWRRTGTRLEVVADVERRGAWEVVAWGELPPDVAQGAAFRVVGCGPRRHLLAPHAGKWTLSHLGAGPARSLVWGDGAAVSGRWIMRAERDATCAQTRLALEVVRDGRVALSWVDLDRSVELARVPLPVTSAAEGGGWEVREGATWSLLVTAQDVTVFDWSGGAARTARLPRANVAFDRPEDGASLWLTGHGAGGAFVMARLVTPNVAATPVRGALDLPAVAERALDTRP